MLWAEDGRHVHAGRFPESIDYVPEGVVNRGAIADDANTGAPKARRFEQDVGTKTHRAGRRAVHVSHF